MNKKSLGFVFLAGVVLLLTIGFAVAKDVTKDKEKELKYKDKIDNEFGYKDKNKYDENGTKIKKDVKIKKIDETYNVATVEFESEGQTYFMISSVI